MNHGRACHDDACDWCERRAEERAADEPLSAGETEGRENSYEAYMDAWIR